MNVWRRPPKAPGEPRRRIVLLGASNAARGLSVLLPAARQSWGGPLDVLAAWGHGRCFTRPGYFLARQLPPIPSCGLWAALGDRPPLPLAALITDVGNDLVYGVEPAPVIAAVEKCLQRLADVADRIVVTQLPLASLERLGPWRFHIMRRAFFPTSRVSLDLVRRRAAELNEMLVEVALQHGGYVVRPADEWYGLDPIHIRRGKILPAWQKFFLPWRDGQPATEIERLGWLTWGRVKRTPPQQRRVFGRSLHARQPAAQLRDGTRLSLY